MNGITRILPLLILAALLPALGSQARTRTTITSIKVTQAPLEQLPTAPADSTAGGAVDPMAVTLRAYNKRASDSRESFLITNNTRHRLSHVTLLLRYSDLDGQLLHERNVSIAVQLRPGQTQLVSIKSWDTQRMFYYYGGPRPRKSATPYRVAYRLTGFEVPVGNVGQ